MPDYIEINGEKVARGEDKLINLSIARLPTYTSIDLPVRVIRGEKPGPVLLISGGLHGDEINGIEIVRRMLVKNILKPESGSVIAIPLMNVYGFIQNVRGVPDGKDINRSFPGSKSGSLANLVAYNIMKEIIPKIDYGIDFHTGGASRSNFPQIRCTFDVAENIELAKVFSPPVILHSKLIEKSFRKAAYKKGKQILVFETGESLRIDNTGIEEAIKGTQRLMKHLGMIKNAPEPQKTEIFEKSSWVRAKIAGLFHPKINLGDNISKRQLLGRITDPYGNETVKVVSNYNGKVIGLNYNPVVHKGDAILHIANRA
ncbi:MAG TPA: succinylglutamate desuccinylase/aspartoacylase family protein [Bacteroidales bacterium]|nr:succinylglutamate desuccinylase/aspartoacylase family protein [Bacteroidales bacterium]